MTKQEVKEKILDLIVQYAVETGNSIRKIEVSVNEENEYSLDLLVLHED